MPGKALTGAQKLVSQLLCCRKTGDKLTVFHLFKECQEHILVGFKKESLGT